MTDKIEQRGIHQQIKYKINFLESNYIGIVRRVRGQC